ncbi:hypothetical protein V8G54_006195 [Vigna mungo]|uniref:Thaumatin-like protein n=1 Tax=Vigna mungo TaxID=3915 RepID=A0AAQ3S727_VIGMU
MTNVSNLGRSNAQRVLCNGNGATPPATLAEFTLGSGSPDYYDVSLVDSYNLPMMVESSGGSGSCATTGCGADLNRRCPTELRVEGDDTFNDATSTFTCSAVDYIVTFCPSPRYHSSIL